jgi:predicted CXXCH cytochrome family protein
VQHRIWRAYFVQPNTDWWVPFYPADNNGRPTGPLCDGCHSVNYNIQTKRPTEWNVGCERCHGPGSEHVRDPKPANIVNPARLDYVHANDTCIQCHSQGKPLKNPIEGKYYDWPVGFQQGLNLRDFWELEEHKLGETNFMHFADGTAHKNRMQGNDFVQSVMYTRGVTCFSCHDVHGTGNNADLVRPAKDLCTTCHGPNSPNGPHAASIEAHTHHERGQPRERVRGVSHAADRADDRGHQRAEPHVQVHHAVDERRVQDPESVHELSYGSGHHLGPRDTQDVGRHVALARQLARRT